MPGPLSRRDFLRLGAGAAALACSPRAPALPDTPPLAQSVIPSSGVRIARVGLGTWQTFDAGADRARRTQLTEVLRVFIEGGGSLIDTSPMYGSSEEVLGDLLREIGLRDRAFLATKVWTRGSTAGEHQMQESLRRLRTERVELMQIHNLVDWRTHLRTLRQWKDAGRIAHLGVTHYASSALEELARVVRAEKIDFVQYALSLDEPEAADDFLRLCADRGVAFIANRPFGGGGALARSRGKALPAWAEDAGVESWAQFLLKWVLSHPGVACAIPGTSRPQHMRDNLQAARGWMPSPSERAKMAAAWRAL